MDWFSVKMPHQTKQYGTVLKKCLIDPREIHMLLGTSYNLPAHAVKAQVSLFTCAACVFTVLYRPVRIFFLSPLKAMVYFFALCRKRCTLIH